MAEAGLELAYEVLPSEQLEWLEALPRRVTIAEDYLLVHDHPKHQDKYVYPHEFLTLRRYLDDYAGVVIAGDLLALVVFVGVGYLVYKRGDKNNSDER